MASVVGGYTAAMPLALSAAHVGWCAHAFRSVRSGARTGEAIDAGATVNLKAILDKGLASKAKRSEMFKILGDGEVTKAVTVQVDAITASAPPVTTLTSPGAAPPCSSSCSPRPPERNPPGTAATPTPTRMVLNLDVKSPNSPMPESSI